MKLEFSDETVNAKVLGKTRVGQSEYMVFLDERRDVWIYRIAGERLKEITNKKEFVKVCDHLNSLITEGGDENMSKNDRFQEEDQNILRLDIAEIASTDTSPREIRQGISKRYIEEEPKENDDDRTDKRRKEEDDKQKAFHESRQSASAKEDDGIWNEEGKSKRDRQERKEPERQSQSQRRVEVDTGESKTTFLTDESENDEVYIIDLHTGEVHSIDTQPFKIGKLPDNDVVLAFNVVSKHHAEIASYGGKYFIRDCGSLNGTFIDGFRLPKETDIELKNGQEFTLANKKFKFHC